MLYYCAENSSQGKKSKLIAFVREKFLYLAATYFSPTSAVVHISVFQLQENS